MDLSRREIIAEAVKDFFKQNCNSSIYKSDENFNQRDAVDAAAQDEVRPSFCAGLLAADPSDDNDEEIFKMSQYPKYPLYLEVTFGICEWLENGCPFTRRIAMPLLNEEVSREKSDKLCEECEPIVNRIRNFLERNEFDTADNKDMQTGNTIAGISKTKASKLVKLSDDNDEFDSFKDISRRMDPLAEDETLEALVHNLLCVLKERGILHLLGIRETAGSIDVLPPPCSALLDSFNAKHNEKSMLTVGARALSKHFHRCQTSSWWGDCKGTESKKNQHALDVLKKIVKDCVWINIHGLPHDVKIIELR